MPGGGQPWVSGAGLRNDEENPPTIELEGTSPNASTSFLPQFNTEIDSSGDEIGETGPLNFSHNSTVARCKSDLCLSSVPYIIIMRRILVEKCRWPKRYGNFLWVIVIVLGVIAVAVTLFGKVGRMVKSGSKAVDVIAKFGKDETWKKWPKLEHYFGGLEELVLLADNHPEYPPRGSKNEMNDMEPNLEENFLDPVSKVFDPYYKAREDKLYVGCDYNDYHHHHDGESEEEHQQEGGAERPLKTRARPEVRFFKGIPQGHPDPIFGSYEELGLDSSICFERYGRLGAYGFGYGVNEGGLGVGEGTHTKKYGEGGEGPGTMPMQKIDWTGIDWGRVQGRCIEQNKARFAPPATEDSGDTGSLLGPRKTSSSEKEAKVQRTAFLLRTWDDYKYTSNDIINLRSIISELSINSGGEYTVHLLVHVKDPSIPIWADKQTYNDHLQSSVPREFWGIATLWNEPLMALTYSSLPTNEFRGLPVHGVYRSSFMPVQWFALNHPEYEYFWNWEMDVRYLGHLYHFLETTVQWAQQQERRFLWDRSERFWIPSVYGNWLQFTHMVRHTAKPSRSSLGGSVPVPGVDEFPTDTKYPGPGRGGLEDWSWGSGDPADLITFSPLFNPNNTGWLLEQDTSGYTKQPPRRAAIIATSRLSRRLLLSMHRENAHYKHTAFTEMWPATCALHHGLKAVYFPHPVYIDRRWPVWYVEKTFNHGPQGTSGGAPESVFGPDREHNFSGTTWYYNSVFAGEFYKRWALGKAEDGKGRICTRGILLHPVKNVSDKL
ncbi:hypothetical protein EV426DRAFT_542836 [Tirmania nivea]|nr:hypothetical protein EV426DRAFT_542836 [Tirmania nivea]